MTEGLETRDRPRVVLVDDSAQVRTIVRAALDASGLFEVVGEGGDGGEAIALVHRLHPDLLLLDTSMPTMDGLEALPAVLALSPETRVVILQNIHPGDQLPMQLEALRGRNDASKHLSVDRIDESKVWQPIATGFD